LVFLIHTKNDCITSNAENTTAAQPNAFLNEIFVHPLLFTKKGRSAFYRADTCQDQLHTTQ